MFNRRNTILTLLAFPFTTGQAMAADSQHRTLSLINQYRKSKGRRELQLSAALQKSAELHAKEVSGRFVLGGKNKSGHKGNNGSSAGSRAKRQGYRYRKIVENFAYDRSPERAVNAWIKSPGHNKNLLDRSIKNGGIGVSGNIYIFVGAKPK